MKADTYLDVREGATNGRARAALVALAAMLAATFALVMGLSGARAWADEAVADDSAVAADAVADDTADAATADASLAQIDVAGGLAFYSITPEETGYYVIAASSDSDTYAYLYDSSWNLLLECDDSVSGYDAEIIALLEAGETYYAAFGFYDIEETGSFTVSATQLAVNELACGESFLVAIDAMSEYAYCVFTPEEDGIYTFFTEGAYDTYAYLYDASWNLLDYDDDSAGDYNARINAAMEAGQTYYLVFCLYYTDESGEFAVVAQEMTTETIVAGDSYSVTIDSGEVLYCAVTPEETAVYSFYTTGDADTYLLLYDADWELIGYDDDSGEDYNALISAVIEAGETCYLAIDLYDSSETADFVLVTEQTAIGEFDAEGENAADVDGSGLSTYWYYTPAEDGLYTFTVASVDGYAGIFVYDADWEYLAGAYVGEDSLDDYYYDDDYDYDELFAVSLTTASLTTASLIGSIDDADDDAERATVTLALAAGQTYCIELAYSTDDVPESLTASVAAAEVESLVVGEGAQGASSESGETDYFSITPDETGVYAFSTSGGLDTYLCLYDATGTVVAYDDDSGEDYNALLHAQLEAGQTYYLEVYLFGSSESYADDEDEDEVEDVAEAEIAAVADEADGEDDAEGADAEATYEVTVERIEQVALEDVAGFATTVYAEYVAEEDGLAVFGLTGAAESEDLTGELAIYTQDWELLDASDENGNAYALLSAGNTYYVEFSADAAAAGLDVEVSYELAELSAEGYEVVYDGADGVLAVQLTYAVEASGPVTIELAGTAEGDLYAVVLVCDSSMDYAGYLLVSAEEYAVDDDEAEDAEGAEDAEDAAEAEDADEVEGASEAEDDDDASDAAVEVVGATDVVLSAEGTYFVAVLVYGAEESAADLVLSVETTEIVELVASDSDALLAQTAA